MKNPLYQHPFTQLITLIIIMLFSLLVFSALGLLVAIPLFHLSISSLFKNLTPETLENNILLFKYLQTIQSIGLFVIPPFIFAWFYSRKPIHFLKLSSKPELSSAAYVVLIIFIGMPFIGYLGELNQAIHFPHALKGVEHWLTQKETSAEEITQKFLTAKTHGDLILNILMIGVFPAIGEELVFRGVLLKLFHNWTKNIHWAIFISAAIFSAMHVQFYGFLPRLFLGILFGYFLFWGRTIWLPILAHFVNNTSAVVYYYYLQKHGSIPDTATFNSTSMPIPVVIFSLGGIFLLGYLLYLNEHKSGYQ